MKTVNKFALLWIGLALLSSGCSSLQPPTQEDAARRKKEVEAPKRQWWEQDKLPAGFEPSFPYKPFEKP